jgi:hypothetical protein
MRLRSERRTSDPAHHVVYGDLGAAQVSHHMPVEQHRDPVSELVHLGEIVGDQENGHAL